MTQIHRSLTRPVLLGGSERAPAIFNATTMLGIGLGPGFHRRSFKAFDGRRQAVQDYTDFGHLFTGISLKLGLLHSPGLVPSLQVPANPREATMLSLSGIAVRWP
jgi:hypothetical protein